MSSSSKGDKIKPEHECNIEPENSSKHNIKLGSMSSSLVDPTETWQTRRILKNHTYYRYNVHDVHKHVREVHTCSFLHCVPQEATCGCCGACCFLSVLGQHRNFLIWVAAAKYSSPSLVFSFQIAKPCLTFDEPEQFASPCHTVVIILPCHCELLLPLRIEMQGYLFIYSTEHEPTWNKQFCIMLVVSMVLFNDFEGCPTVPC